MKDKNYEEIFNMLKSYDHRLFYYILDDPRALQPSDEIYAQYDIKKLVQIKEIFDHISNNTKDKILIFFTGTFRMYEHVNNFIISQKK